MGETNVKDHQAPKCLHWPRWSSHININAMHSALWQRCETPKAGTEYVANFLISIGLLAFVCLVVPMWFGWKGWLGKHCRKQITKWTNVWPLFIFATHLESNLKPTVHCRQRTQEHEKHAICTCGYKRNPPVFCLVAFWHGNNIGKQHAIWPKHTKTISGQHNFKETLFFEVYFFDAMAFLRNLIAPQRRQKYLVFRPIEKRWQLSQSPRPRRGKPSIMVRN